MKHSRSDWKTKWTPFLRQIAWLDFSVTATFVRIGRLDWIFDTFVWFYFKTRDLSKKVFTGGNRPRCALVDTEGLASGHVTESVAVSTATTELELVAESLRRVVVEESIVDSSCWTVEAGIRWAGAFVNCFKILLVNFTNFQSQLHN